MIVEPNSLYILVEGEPDSPEVGFFEPLITRIIQYNNLSNIHFSIVDTGGSSSFHVFAKRIYLYSRIHRKIPVIAISDSDYTPKIRLSDNLLIDDTCINKRAQILYWKRHEWENYLLEESELITLQLNQLPSNAHGRKSSKKSDKILDKNGIDSFLKEYFINTLKEEFAECLKFNLSNSYTIKRPQIEICENLGDHDIEYNKQWFCSKASTLKIDFELKDSAEKLFDDIIKDLPWEIYLNNATNSDLFEIAKQRFRGKEAFNKLYNFLIREYLIHNLSCNDLKIGLLKVLIKSDSSKIFLDLQEMLMPFLKRIETLASV